MESFLAKISLSVGVSFRLHLPTLFVPTSAEYRLRGLAVNKEMDCNRKQTQRFADVWNICNTEEVTM